MSEEKKISPRQLRELVAVVSRHLSLRLPAAVAQSVIDKPGDLELELDELFRRIAEQNERMSAGKLAIASTKHLIDCDADPYLPGNFTVEEHWKGGQLEWDPDKIALYLSPWQMGCGVVQGHALRKGFENQPVLNACVLDYLLAHPELIPSGWMGNAVFFWGTIYRSKNGLPHVRYLYWDGGRWNEHTKWLDDDFGRSDTAAVSVRV